ncbi:hypothetical protein G5V59_04405 [Nocardioides sp. W3-2-3]|uniref:hypothetical protein n=1 Tax=Nocardioides convexus TaxID=2712224 RepID=UPI0024181AEF|nr:hypothetical protein [Nocardioides convexus]NGZ99814.1 hypothetical protein [Nocardioides convexus]
MHAYRPRVFTPERVAALRRGPAASLPRGRAALGARRDHGRACRGRAAPQARPAGGAVHPRGSLVAVNRDADPCRAVGEIARRHGLTSEVPESGGDGATLPRAEPSRARRSTPPGSSSLVTEDLVLSAEGNADGPVKAGLDVLRDVRQAHPGRGRPRRAHGGRARGGVRALVRAAGLRPRRGSAPGPAAPACSPSSTAGWCACSVPASRWSARRRVSSRPRPSSPVPAPGSTSCWTPASPGRTCAPRAIRCTRASRAPAC